MSKTYWYKEAIVYQIYPFSFKDSNNDGMGDIGGVIEKLDYIKDLGATAIWFSPLYDSPNHDNGYDIRDYRKISEKFGTMNDFKRLLDECHKRDLKVIMDMVLNHTSNEHEWFKKALEGDEKYRNYYIIRKGKKDKKGRLVPPNNYGSCFTESAWERIGETDEYYLHLFAVEQPDLNWDNPEVRKELTDILNFYLEMGVDGFRFDVFNLFSKTEGLPDENSKGFPKGSNYFIDGPHIHEYLNEIYRNALSKYDIFSVGESMRPSEENAIKYVSEESGELDCIFNFAHFASDSIRGLKYPKKPFNIKQFKNGFFEPQEKYFEHGWNTLVLENHDNPRCINRFGLDPKYRYEASTMLAITMYFGFGIPFIYQGQECAIPNNKFYSMDEIDDPEAKFVYGLLSKFPLPRKFKMKIVSNGLRDHARIPMPWDDSLNGGFNEGEKPWIKLHEDYKEFNVKKDMEDELSIHDFYKEVIELKKNIKALIYGRTKEYSHNNKKVVAYTREYENEKYFIISNFKKTAYDYYLPIELQEDDYDLVISNYDDAVIRDNVCHLAPYQAILFKVRGENEKPKYMEQYLEDEDGNLFDPKKAEIKKEYSYGAVLYRIENGKIEYLVEHMTLGHVSLPKGHIEEGETIEECVRREIKEELNLEIDLDMTQYHTITYSPRPSVIKDVTFYTAKPTSFEIKTQLEEVLSAEWLTYDDAYSVLTHESDKETLEDLNDYIVTKERLY